MGRRVYVLVECEVDPNQAPSQSEAEDLVLDLVHEAVLIKSTSLGKDYWIGLGLDIGGVKVSHIDAVEFADVKGIAPVKDREIKRSMQRAHDHIASLPRWQQAYLDQWARRTPTSFDD